MTFGVRWGNGRFANRPYGERGRDGERGGGCTPILTFPPEGGREGIEGEVCTPIPRLHEGRL